jgi:hypothetical protein
MRANYVPLVHAGTGSVWRSINSTLHEISEVFHRSPPCFSTINFIRLRRLFCHVPVHNPCIHPIVQSFVQPHQDYPKYKTSRDRDPKHRNDHPVAITESIV